MHGGNVIDLLGFPLSECLALAPPPRVERRPPVVAVGEYVCLACRELHPGRAAQLELGCLEAVAA